MLKRIILLKRKPGLSRGDMLHYWQHVHAPLAMQFPAWFESTHRYTQNHLAEQVQGSLFDFDGMVESWQREGGGVGSSFPDSQAYKEVVGPDELKFVDRASSVLFFVNERAVMVRSGGVKLFRFLARRPELSAEEFSARWEQGHAASMSKLPGFWALLRGYAQNLVVPGSKKVLGAPRAPPPPPVDAIDGIEELRFDSGQQMSAVLASNDYAAYEADGLGFSAPVVASVVSREVPLYDRNKAQP
jgi:hypothetical protein